MTELETLARDLRDKLRSQWPEDQDRGYNEPLAPGWNFVARHVAQLQREAWIAGRDAARGNVSAREIAEMLMRDKARKEKDTDRAQMHSDRAQAFREAAFGIGALEPPAQETSV